MKFYKKNEIEFSPSNEIYNSITDILGVKPTDFYDNKDDETLPSIWTYEVITKEEDEYFDFVNNFLDILEGKYEKLAKLEISRDKITFWLFYEYDQQCNMEFDPKRLKRLGDNGITLCISCWDSGNQ